MFDNMVFIAMENQNYGSVMGTGTGSSIAPFIASLLPSSSTIPFFHGLGASGRTINGCSAGCYLALTSGSDQGKADSYCPRSSVPCLSATNIISRFTAAGLSWQAYCAEGCPRGSDHFPFLAYSNTDPNACALSGTCGNTMFTGSGVTTSTFIAEANSASPPSFLWYTPTDSENMHDNSVSSGDSYLKSFLVGTGSVSSPSSGSLLASNLFGAGHRALLVLWWDEYDPSPILFYGNSSHTRAITRIPALTASFSFVPTQPLSSQSIAFTGTATGGVSPYSYSWNFGDGNLGTGQTPSHIYTTSGTFTVSLDVIDFLKTSIVISQPITVSSQLQLTADLTISPASPTVNSTIAFTGSAVNGISPYTFTWNFGDNSKATGATVTHIYSAAGTFIISLNVTDNTGSQARTSRSIMVLLTSGGGGGLGPLVIGWGGISLNEVTRFATGNPPSNVFLGQQASDMESVVMLIQSKGMNGIRVSWDPSCTASPSPIGANYTASELSTAIQIASYYRFWIILDYHGYTDQFTPATSACWLSFWAGVTNQFKNSYGQIIWEPENEPRYGFTGSACSGVIACVPYLSNEYQMFINQTRAQGDTHWIIVENICSYGCGLDPNGDGSLPGAIIGYPTVADPAGHVFISLHSYLNNPTSWTYAGADAYARGYYDTVLAGIAKTSWPALNTEGGADAFVGIGGPNATLTGSAGYNNITLRFIQTLTNLYDSAPTRIGYTWWTAGDWTNTPDAGSLGALQCDSKPQGWGCLLQHKPIVQTPPTPKFTLTFQGYDYDGAYEVTIKVNNNLLARLPTNDTSRNAGTYRTIALNITSLIVIGNNTLTFTHANWDCGTIDNTENVTITNATGTVIFSDPTVRALSCAQSITYTFTIDSTSTAVGQIPVAFYFTAIPAFTNTC